MGKLPAAAQDNVDTKGLLSEKVSRLAGITHRQEGGTHTKTHTHRKTHREADTHIYRLKKD